MEATWRSGLNQGSLLLCPLLFSGAECLGLGPSNIQICLICIFPENKSHITWHSTLRLVRVSPVSSERLGEWMVFSCPKENICVRCQVIIPSELTSRMLFQTFNVCGSWLRGFSKVMTPAHLCPTADFSEWLMVTMNYNLTSRFFCIYFHNDSHAHPLAQNYPDVLNSCFGPGTIRWKILLGKKCENNYLQEICSQSWI